MARVHARSLPRWAFDGSDVGRPANDDDAQLKHALIARAHRGTKRVGLLARLHGN